jgi:hypothetical protein
LLPSLENILLLRNDPETYMVVYDYILPCIVGKVYWKKAVQGRLAVEIATTSDEALALLILENSWNCWTQEASLSPGQKLAAVETRERTKWTSNSMSSGKYEGWGTEGVPRYNVLCAAVKKDRRDNEAFDKEYQRRCREQQEGRKKDKNSTKKARQSVVASYNDMDDLDIQYCPV